MKLTAAVIKKLTCPAGKDEVAYADDDLPGLTLRIRKAGAKAWYYRYRDAHGRSHRLRIGNAQTILPDDARSLARKSMVEVAAGGSPVEKRKAARQAQTCGELFKLYLDHAEVVQRPTTLDGTKRHLTRNAAPLAPEPVSTVTRSRMKAFRDKLAENLGKVQVNRTMATLSACWSWGLRNGVIAEGDNPASYIDKFPEEARARVLTMGELAAIWKATGEEKQSRHDRLVRTLMLTMVRRSEAGGMRWDEIEGDLWTIPARRMKNGELHEVMMTTLALGQLPKRDNYEFVFGEDAPFSGWSGAKKRLNNKVGFKNWGLHDLRRTFSTVMNAHGLAQPHIIEEILAHIGAKGGVAGASNCATFRTQKKEALEAWVTLLEREGVINAAP